MFISTLDLFKIGIGPSSSHTLGPMVAANNFINLIKNQNLITPDSKELFIRCTLKGSLAFTGKGHSTDRAVALGLHGHVAADLADKDVAALLERIWASDQLCINKNNCISFRPEDHVVFDKGAPLAEHPNGLVFELVGPGNKTVFSETYFSIGGGFISTLAEINELQAPLKMQASATCKFPFDSANSMLQMAKDSDISIAGMKQANELEHLTESVLLEGMDKIWQSMQTCIKNGLQAEGTLPGGLGVVRRAKALYQSLQNKPDSANINDWLCAYAMAVNEENAAGNMVVTAPTNGAAGVIPHLNR
ncbi:MAG: L-serine ammonia-lyase, iron-sulfur-dependent, subunit alpha [Halomonas sp.]|nr:L-serine ammonia-lyase, iron-sulfur-dependent, subunit alpha [Halomonas sp.]